MRSLYFDRDGQPISVEDWCRLFEDLQYKVVGQEMVGEREVSTVWLGLDHSHGRGPPLIFETMVFPECEDCERYSTLKEAEAGHAEAVARLRTGLS